MPDATYDAIIIGGGNKGLVCAMYLQKYGGLNTAIFESRHEVGGSWASEESAAPGFICNTHAADIGDFYVRILERDFPQFTERGCVHVPYQVAYGTIFQEDHTCIAIYSPISSDPSQEKSAGEISRFSKRDADSWLTLFALWEEHVKEATFGKWFHEPVPASFSEPDEFERSLFKFFADPRARKIGADPSWLVKSPLELARDIFESDELIGGLLRITHSGAGLDPLLSGAGVTFLFQLLWLLYFGHWKGGTHSAAHAAYKCYIEEGGKVFTESEVEKVLIKDGKAYGVRLLDGTEVMAGKAVISTLDPFTLCFKFVGREYFDPITVRRVEGLSRWRITAAWQQWAIHELPRYKAAEFCPDIDKTGWLVLGNKDVYGMVRNHAQRSMNMQPDELNPVIYAPTITDSTMAPPGKHYCGTEDFVLGADQLSEKEWREYKKEFNEKMMETWHEYAPNMTWDNVVGCSPDMPIDCCNVRQTAPTGNWATIDLIPSQVGRWRPVPELARHKIPGISGLYATGAAWPPTACASASQGYTCYKVIVEDFNLERFWEKKGYSY